MKYPKEQVVWHDFALEAAPQAAGVYALVVNEPLRKLFKDDLCGILYFGQSENLALRLRKGAEDGPFQHHLLWQVLGAKRGKDGAHGWCFPFTPENCAEPRIWNRQWRVKILYQTIPSGPGHCVQVPEHWEDALLVYHLFHFGQYPPLNVHGRSVGGIADWNEYYGKWHEFNQQYFAHSLEQIAELTRLWRMGTSAPHASSQP